MEKISEMIKRMCPEGVKKVKLKDVGYTYTGLSGKNKDDFKDGNALYVTYSNIFNNPSLNLQIEDKVQINDGEKQNEVLHGDILFTGSSETPEEAGMSSVVLEQPKGRLYLNSFCFGFRLNNMSETYPHYMRYILRDNKVRKFISKTAFGVTRFNINKERMLEVEIPLPPLPIQQEIVRVLDSFTQLQSNLEAELVSRQKQYEFYRNKLLTFDKDDKSVEWKAVKDIFETRNGYTPSTNNPIYWDEGCIPWFKMEDIREKGHILSDSNLHITNMAIKGKGLFKANSIILATSATIGEHALILTEHLSNQRFTNFYPNKCYVDRINMKYMHYYFFIIDKWCKEHTIQGSFAGVNMTELYHYTLPIPSKDRQQEIVSILDTFESLITNLKKEIEARKKQYEYYREQLLTFE